MHQRGVLTPDSQLIYLSQWLGEFSEVEKDDFLQQLLDLYAPGQLAIGHRLAPLKSEDKAPTLFDCRIDLFKQWFASWESSDRQECLDRLKEADAEFIERFQKSRDTPNEDKIIEEFWLRLDNGSAEANGNAATREQPAPAVHGNGTAHVLENGGVEIQENGTAAPTQNGEPAVVENGTSHVEVNGALEDQRGGSSGAPSPVQEDPQQNPTVPTVEISPPECETKDEDEELEPATDDVASAPSDEPVDSGDQGEKSQSVDGAQGAMENES